MAAHGQGFKKYFQFGREATYGVAATVNKRFPILSFTRGLSKEVIYSNAMDGTRSRKAVYAGALRVRPVVEMELNYTGLLLLLDGIFGTDTYATNGGVTTGVNPYTHTFKMRNFFNSFTLEFGMGDIPSGKIERFLGAKIARATISGASHGRLTLRLEFLAKSWSDNISPTGGLTSPTLSCVMFDTLAGTDDGTGAGLPDVTEFEFTIDNALSERNYSAETIDEPLSAGLADATLRITEEFQSVSALDLQTSVTSAAPSLTFGSGNTTFTIGMSNAYLAETPEPQGDDRMLQTLLWRPIGDGGSPNTLVSVAMKNSQSSISA